MTSRTTVRFRKALDALPDNVRAQARVAYRQFQTNPHHPSLRFKQVHRAKLIYSVRVSRDYRAIAVRSGDVMIWFWIGSHADYDNILGQL